MDRVLLLMMIDGYNQIINESEICNDYSLRESLTGYVCWCTYLIMY